MDVTIEFLKKWKTDGKKIAIYCAGTHGRLFSVILKMFGIDPDCFLDNDLRKWGTEVEGIICYEPGICAGREDVIVFICIALPYYYEVFNSAKQKGIVHIADFSDIIDDIISNYREAYLELIKRSADLEPADIFYSLSANKHAVCDDGEEPVNGRIAVYTGIFGDYDEICRPQVCPPNIDYYFISDKQPVNSFPFRWIDGKKVIPDNVRTPIKRNRYIKMHPHRLFPRYQYSVYIDGNITVTADISGFVHRNKSGISVFMLPWRECIYYEALAVVNARRVVAGDVCRQVERYLEEGMPMHYGLPEMPVIAMEHSKCKKIMEDWWKEFDSGAQRDQLSFMYAMWKNGMTLTDITSLGENVRESTHLYKKEHFSKSKNIGNHGGTV